ncbi:hypothetical protein CBR_g48472 [Chara braunii]|uniref:Uncharacterized protein n=1 Tax=Chara braunii TaxID=69332 RepID=A0A388M2Q5_CHABU|nr:hypothetical protein CBR_g48472 [Chara braunii]|eukprot:GBG88860.1 hypothetical protein CBR_g48472 [Chara braunii]
MESCSANLARYERPLSAQEHQARSTVFRSSGLREQDYGVIFVQHPSQAMAVIGEVYPFSAQTMCLNCLGGEEEPIQDAARRAGAKLISAPRTWLDLRIPGSQLSLNIRKSGGRSSTREGTANRGLFAFPATATSVGATGPNGTAARYSLHWVSEARRNGFLVLLDTSAIIIGRESIALSTHRPDFVLCSVAPPTAYTRYYCLLFRRGA